MESHIIPPALYQEVAERLRQRIFTSQLSPGNWIDEQRLAEEYGISRTPLREALKVLASEGLVNLRPRRGCYVAEISVNDLRDIFPLLALLEGRALAEIIARGQTDDLDELELLHDKMERAARDGKTQRFFDANQEFHQKIQELSGNRRMLAIVQDLRKVMRLYQHGFLRHGDRLHQSLEEHRHLMEAIRARDAAHAETAMRNHLLRCLEMLPLEESSGKH